LYKDTDTRRDASRNRWSLNLDQYVPPENSILGKCYYYYYYYSANSIAPRSHDAAMCYVDSYANVVCDLWVHSLENIISVTWTW